MPSSQRRSTLLPRPAMFLSLSQNLTQSDISDWDGDQGWVLAFLEGVGLAASKHDLGRCCTCRGRGEVHQVSEHILGVTSYSRILLYTDPFSQIHRPLLPCACCSTGGASSTAGRKVTCVRLNLKSNLLPVSHVEFWQSYERRFYDSERLKKIPWKSLVWLGETARDSLRLTKTAFQWLCTLC